MKEWLKEVFVEDFDIVDFVTGFFGFSVTLLGMLFWPILTNTVICLLLIGACVFCFNDKILKKLKSEIKLPKSIFQRKISILYALVLFWLSIRMGFMITGVLFVFSFFLVNTQVELNKQNSKRSKQTQH